jgi:hypothetical protein
MVIEPYGIGKRSVERIKVDRVELFLSQNQGLIGLGFD